MILDDIVKDKLEEIQRLKLEKPLASLKKETRQAPHVKGLFLEALRMNGPVAVIAEIKRKSPSKGLIRRDFVPADIAYAYERGGAAALSVLTDEKYFGGSAEILKEVKSSSKLPVLRKDFILDEYQVYESFLMGADAILLIAAILSHKKLLSLKNTAEALGLDVLFETHTEGDMVKVLSVEPKMVGINNRDLYTFKVTLETSEQLLGLVPKGVMAVSESGIQTRADLERVRKYGAGAVLVGEGLMRESDIELALKKLKGS